MNSVAQAGRISRYLCASSDICGYLQISVGIFKCQPPVIKILTAHMEYTESLQVPPGTHEACRLSPSLAYEAQVCLTVAWPGRTESLAVICRPAWPLANAVCSVLLLLSYSHF